MNVSDQFHKIAVTADQQGFIEALEQMADLVFSCIDVTGITEAQILHDSGKRHRTNFNEQMDMIGHQAKSMNAVLISFKTLMQQEIKTTAVIAGKKDILPAIAAKHDMIKSTGIMYARFTSHTNQVIRQNVKISSLTRFFIIIKPFKIWVKFFCAIRTYTMTEFSFGMISDVRFNLIPITLVIPNFFYMKHR